MSETISTNIYIQTNTTANTWLDITQDVLFEGLSWTKGVPSSDPLERMADVGVLNMTLRNDGTTGVEHRYTPGHINCTAGFSVRCKVKVVSTWRGISKTQWAGWIPPDGISQSLNGPISKFTHVIAYDYIYFLLNNPVTLVDILSNKTFGEVGQELVDLITAKPTRIDLSQYVETFANTNDTAIENTTIYAELDKAVKSELGYVLVKYEVWSGADDILIFEGRTHRDTVARFSAVPNIIDDCPYILDETSGYYFTDELGNPIVADSATAFDYLTGITNYSVINGAHYANRWIGKTYPRKVGTTAVIFRLNEPIKLDAKETRQNYRVRYIVEDGYKSISAQNVSLTDFAMNSAEDGSGTDMTADLTVVGTYGSGDAQFTELTNESETDGWITVLEISGDPIYIGDTVSQVVEIASGDDTLYGKIEVTLDQKYQADPIRTFDQITLLSTRYGAQRLNTVDDIKFCANKNEVLAAIYSMTDLSARLPIYIPEYNISEDYFVNGIETSFESNKIWCKFFLKPARVETYVFWQAGVPGFSELGNSTTFGIDL